MGFNVQPGLLKLALLLHIFLVLGLRFLDCLASSSEGDVLLFGKQLGTDALLQRLLLRFLFNGCLLCFFWAGA